MTQLDVAIFLAWGSAVISWASNYSNATNTALLSTAHWLVVLLLLGNRSCSQHALQTDIEATWLVYGFLMGEIASDNAASLTLIMMSAFFFQRHRRDLRCNEANEDCMEADDNSLTDGDSAAL